MKQSLRAWIQETALVHRVRTKLLSNEERAWQEHAQELRSYLLHTDRMKRSVDRLSSNFRGQRSGHDSSETCKSMVLTRLDEFFVTERMKAKPDLVVFPFCMAPI